MLTGTVLFDNLTRQPYRVEAVNSERDVCVLKGIDGELHISKFGDFPEAGRHILIGRADGTRWPQEWD